MKVIFTPFSVRDAGTLSNALRYSPDIQAGYAASKQEQGKYRGFKQSGQGSDFIYAPAKSGDKYVPTPTLTRMINPEDQLYINAHCLRGLSYISTNVKCDGNTQVDAADLVAQLVALGLPQNTQAKIKLWICQGALADGVKRSFVDLFSVAMHGAGYRECRIFGYTESLMSEYKRGAISDGDDGGWHKRVSPEPPSDESRLSKAIEIAASRTDKDSLTLTMMWNHEKKQFQGDEALAKASILASKIKRDRFLGTAPMATTGARASRFRKEFKNGRVVGA